MRSPTIPQTLAQTSPVSSRSDEDVTAALHVRLDALERRSGAHALAVAVYDTETHFGFRRHADRWFHAASTIKVAILLGVYETIHHGWLHPQSRLHVRNRFFSAVDGAPFRVLADRDGNSEVHAAVGKMMRVTDLAAALDQARLGHGEVRAVGSPRRLAVWAREVAPKQGDARTEAFGPPVAFLTDLPLARGLFTPISVVRFIGFLGWFGLDLPNPRTGTPGNLAKKPEEPDEPRNRTNRSLREPP